MNQSASSLKQKRDTPNKKFSVKTSFLRCAKFCGLFALSRMLTAGKTRILAYHGIWLGDGHFGNFLYMSREKFAKRMALLEKWGYPVVAFDGRPEGKSRLSCPTVITIDDGWYSTWSEMLPVLEKHGYPATVYLTTYYCLNQTPVIDVALSYCFSVMDARNGVTINLQAYALGQLCIDSDAARKKALTEAQNVCASLDNDQAKQRFLKAVCDEIGVDHEALLTGRWFHIMNSEQVKDSANRGITFEAHTHHHRISHQGQDTLAEEIERNSQCIHQLTNRRPEHFCYPSGRFTKELWPVLEQCNMKSATTTDIGFVDEKTPRYAMPRILDGEDVTELEFEAEMSGFMELLRNVRNSVGNKQG